MIPYIVTSNYEVQVFAASPHEDADPFVIAGFVPRGLPIGSAFPLTPQDARDFAAHLVKIADAIDAGGATQSWPVI